MNYKAAWKILYKKMKEFIKLINALSEPKRVKNNKKAMLRLSALL